MERTSTGERVAHYISRQIFDGSLTPGTRVPQDEIAQRLGVSRIPVREALIALEREGWVRNELHRGAFISPLDRQSVQDHYDLFGMLYGFGTTLTIERGDFAAAGAQLRAICRRLSRGTTIEFQRHAVAFHRTIVEASGSARLATVLRSLSGLVPGDFFELVPEARKIERRQMPRIATAVADGDAPEGRALYNHMMHAVGERVVELFTSRGLFDTPAKDT